MHFAELPVSQLKPAPYNPRKKLRPGMPEYERLKRSIEEFELVQPIVWNETTGHVVGGHQRLQVLTDRGEQSVGCVVVQLSLAREKALNIALNNPQVGGQWDQPQLIDLVAELQSLPDFDATLTGFSEADIRHLQFQPVAVESREESSSVDCAAYLVTLTVPPSQWDDVQSALDDLLATCPEVRLHVRAPQISRR